MTINHKQFSYYAIFATINPNYHNKQYGFDCYAQAEIVGHVYALDEDHAAELAYTGGITYNPELYQFKNIFNHAVKII